MKHYKTFLLSLLFFSLVFSISCLEEESLPNFDVTDIEGMVPIYEEEMQLDIESSREIVSTGRFIYYNDYILITERNEGVHVIDNNNRSNPINKYFIRIKGNTDLSIRNDVIYANSGPDLVAFKIMGDTIQELNRITEVFYSYAQSQDFPSEQTNVYFQCPDLSRGRILYWKKEIISQPDCYKN